MSSLILILIVVFAFLIVMTIFNKKNHNINTINLPYRPAGKLFSIAELSFLHVLDQAVGNEYRVFGKVRVADIASVQAGLSNSARQSALNRIACKHFDFIICRSNDLSIICAVELNDKSHNTKKVQVRDELLSKVCKAINLPLVMITAKHTYSIQEIKVQFLDAISLS